MPELLHASSLFRHRSYRGHPVAIDLFICRCLHAVCRRLQGPEEV